MLMSGSSSKIISLESWSNKIAVLISTLGFDKRLMVKKKYNQRQNLKKRKNFNNWTYFKREHGKNV